jgi:hypothetical protein
MRQLLLDRSLTSVLLHREYDSEPGEHKRNHEKLQPVHPDCFPKLATPNETNPRRCFSYGEILGKFGGSKSQRLVTNSRYICDYTPLDRG